MGNRTSCLLNTSLYTGLFNKTKIGSGVHSIKLVFQLLLSNFTWTFKILEVCTVCTVLYIHHNCLCTVTSQLFKLFRFQIFVRSLQSRMGLCYCSGTTTTPNQICSFAKCTFTCFIWIQLRNVSSFIFQFHVLFYIYHFTCLTLHVSFYIFKVTYFS